MVLCACCRTCLVGFKDAGEEMLEAFSGLEIQQGLDIKVCLQALGVSLHVWNKSCVQAFVVPERVMWKLVNCFKWCHLSCLEMETKRRILFIKALIWTSENNLEMYPKNIVKCSKSSHNSYFFNHHFQQKLDSSKPISFFLWACMSAPQIHLRKTSHLATAVKKKKKKCQLGDI